jgi:hypothetical protein
LGKNFVRGVGLRTFHLIYSVAEPYPAMLGGSIGTLITYLREKKIEQVIPLEFHSRKWRGLTSSWKAGRLWGR